MAPPAPVIADAAAFNASNRDLSDRDYDVVAQARYRASDSSDYEVAVARKTRSPNLWNFISGRPPMPARAWRTTAPIWAILR